MCHCLCWSRPTFWIPQDTVAQVEGITDLFICEYALSMCLERVSRQKQTIQHSRWNCSPLVLLKTVCCQFIYFFQVGAALLHNYWNANPQETLRTLYLVCAYACPTVCCITDSVVSCDKIFTKLYIPSKAFSNFWFLFQILHFQHYTTLKTCRPGKTVLGTISYRRIANLDKPPWKYPRQNPTITSLESLNTSWWSVPDFWLRKLSHFPSLSRDRPSQRCVNARKTFKPIVANVNVEWI